MSTTGHGHGELDSGLPSTGQGNPAHEAAFFDLDRTLVGGSTLFYVALAAYKVGFLTRRQMISGAIANIRFRLSGLTDEGAQQLRERVRRELSGVEENAMRRLMPAVLAGILPRIYPQMLDIAYRHKDAGRQVYIFTASSQGIAELLAAILDFDDGIGTRPEIINGHYTGHIKGAYIYREGKAQAVRELAAHKGINLADSWAYCCRSNSAIWVLPAISASCSAVFCSPIHEVTASTSAPFLSRSVRWSTTILSC